MKAGLTGYAQIAGKYNTTPRDKLIMDMMYIEQFSILRDIQLILQTAVDTRSRVSDSVIEEQIQKADTVFMYDVPSQRRLKIMRLCYQYKVNVYFNPYLEDIMEINAVHYVLDDVYLFNKNIKSLTMEQRIMKRLLDIGLSLVLGILSSPLWIVGAIAVKAYDGGHVLLNLSGVPDSWNVRLILFSMRDCCPVRTKSGLRQRCGIWNRRRNRKTSSAIHMYWNSWG